jgi:hypothetical protein
MNEKPLGDRIFRIAIIVFASVWIAGWLALLFIELLKKLFPKHEAKLEQSLQKARAVLAPIQKYSLIIVVGLIVVELLAYLLGWIK